MIFDLKHFDLYYSKLIVNQGAFIFCCTFKNDKERNLDKFDFDTWNFFCYAIYVNHICVLCYSHTKHLS